MAAHTLLTSEDAFRAGAEGLSAWYPAEHQHANRTDWDPEFIRKQGKGARRKTECDPRQEKTQEFKDAIPPVLRPSAVHW